MFFKRPQSKLELRWLSSQLAALFDTASVLISFRRKQTRKIYHLTESPLIHKLPWRELLALFRKNKLKSESANKRRCNIAISMIVLIEAVALPADILFLLMLSENVLRHQFSNRQRTKRSTVQFDKKMSCNIHNKAVGVTESSWVKETTNLSMRHGRAAGSKIGSCFSQRFHQYWSSR